MISQPVKEPIFIHLTSIPDIRAQQHLPHQQNVFLTIHCSDYAASYKQSPNASQASHSVW